MYASSAEYSSIGTARSETHILPAGFVLCPMPLHLKKWLYTDLDMENIVMLLKKWLLIGVILKKMIIQGLDMGNTVIYCMIAKKIVLRLEI